MYGVYTITKRKAEFIDGEWVAGEIVEVIDNLKNNISKPRYIKGATSSTIVIYRIFSKSKTIPSLNILKVISQSKPRKNHFILIQISISKSKRLRNKYAFISD